jgi:hypothetical protein
MLVVFRSLHWEECAAYIERKGLENATYSKALDGRWEVIDYDRQTPASYCHTVEGILNSWEC